MNQNYDFDEITKQFLFDGDFIKAHPYGFGHINNTYEACFEKGDGTVHRYILQKINVAVFKEPEKLMENIENITSHIRGKVATAGGDPERETLNLVRTKDGKSFYKSSDGDYWRSYIFIEGAKTYQLVENKNHFYNSGRAFGKFQQYLSDFSVHKLHDTIPDFHNTIKRYESFLEAVKNNVCRRAEEVQEEIEFVISRAHIVEVLVKLLNEGELPLRVTHNDTKFNNVMVDDITGEGICVIDLDTVMPGTALYDFGDSIRSGATTAEEDEVDLSKVWVDLDLFESFSKGFLEATAGSLTETETKYLPFSAILMTFECGMRFLTDYLNGDTYFKIHREKHNLDRARNQFKLVWDMEQKQEKMNEIISKITS